MSSKNRLCVGIPVTVFVLSMIQSAPVSAITTEELANICQAMESAFKDISVEHEWGVPRPSTDEPSIPGALMSKGPTKRQWSTKHPFDQRSLTIEHETVINERGDSFESTIMQSYNGQTAKHLVSGGLLPNGTPVEISRGTITERRHFMPPANQTPLAFSVLRLSYVNDNPVPLSDRLRRSALVHLDDVTRQINGFNAIRVDLLVDTPLIEPKPPEIRVYFSVDHGYTPIKYEAMSFSPTGSEPSFVVDINELTEVSKGLWFPSSGSMTSVQTNLINTYRATNIVVNQGLTDSDFDITFSPGTKVSNEITGLRYVVSSAEGQLDTPSEDEDAAGTGQMQSEQEADSEIEAPIPQSQTEAQESQSRTLIYVSAVAIAALLTVLIVRKVR